MADTFRHSLDNSLRLEKECYESVHPLDWYYRSVDKGYPIRNKNTKTTVKRRDKKRNRMVDKSETKFALVDMIEALAEEKKEQAALDREYMEDMAYFEYSDYLYQMDKEDSIDFHGEYPEDWYEICMEADTGDSYENS